MLPFHTVPLSLSLSLSNMPKSQNSKFKCFSGILRCIGSLPTQPPDPTTDIPTTTTTFENPKKNFKTKVRTPGVVARLMGLDLLPYPRKAFRRKEDLKEKSGCTLLDDHRTQHKGFSETYQQWIASVSSQRDGKPYEHRPNRKDSMAQQECKDEHDVLETSKVERSSYPAKRTINSKLSEAEMAFLQQKFMADHGTFEQVLECFEQVLECLDNENLKHLDMMETLSRPLPQHMIISADLRAEKYFKRRSRLDWLEGASSKESTMAVWKLPCQQPFHRQHEGFSETYQQWTASVSSQRDGKPYEHRPNRKDSMAQQECKDEHDVLETSKVERSSYPAKRTINSKLSEAEMAFLQQKFMADHGSFEQVLECFEQVLECLDNENLKHLDMMETLSSLRTEKYFKRRARLDWIEGASSKESKRAVWKLRCQQNFKTKVRTPGPLHRQHKGFSETYQQWTASVSSQRDGKPYEHRPNRKDSMAQQECKDEHDVMETSKVERSSYPAKRTINSKLSKAEMAFLQQKFMADHGLSHLCSGPM
ncbi:unnamed protein product [Camellia sinensis]